MFENVGEKIKGLAVFTTVMGIIFFVIMGIGICGESVLLGFLTIVMGSVASWIGSLTLYGFGELVTSAKTIADKMNGNSFPQGSYRAPVTMNGGNSPKAAAPVEEDWVCSECGTPNKGKIHTCQGCGVTKQWSQTHS